MKQRRMSELGPKEKAYRKYAKRLYEVFCCNQLDIGKNDFPCYNVFAV